MRKIFLASAITLSACSMSSQPTTTVPAVIQNLETDFQAAGAVSATGVDMWSPAQVTSFSNTVKAHQCKQGAADPVVPVIQKDIEISLHGEFSTSGKMTIGAVLTNPTTGLESDTSSSQQQTISVPVTFTPISNLPGLYMAQQLGYLKGNVGGEVQRGSGMPMAGLSEQDKVLAKRDQLTSIIAGLINGFDSTKCSATSSAGTLMMLKRPH